jgi:hypothetical protein
MWVGRRLQGSANGDLPIFLVPLYLSLSSGFGTVEED